jgi:hypothetical protein
MYYSWVSVGLYYVCVSYMWCLVVYYSVCVLISDVTRGELCYERVISVMCYVRV